MELGLKIQLARKKKGLSQEDLAGLLNVNVETVRDWEDGSVTPLNDDLIQISNMLDVSLDYLKQEPNVAPVEEARTTPVASQSTVRSVRVETVRKLNPGRAGAIRVWLIIGCIISPLYTAGLFVNLAGVYALYVLFMYYITIPLCIIGCTITKTAKRKSDLVAIGIFCIIFLSLIGGIIMVSTPDESFVTIKVEKPVAVQTVRPQPAPVPVAVVPKDLTVIARRRIFNAAKKLKYVKNANIKKSINISLDRFREEAGTIKTEAELTSFTNRLNAVMKQAEGELVKTYSIFAIIIIAIVALIVAAIVIPISVVKNENAKKERERRSKLYDELVSLVYNYQGSISDSRIEYLMSQLSSYYDLRDVRREYTSAINYTNLVQILNKYTGSSDDNKQIENRLKALDVSYKKTRDIKNDFENVKLYTKTVSYTKTTSSDDNATPETAAANRQAIKYLYTYANTSELWNFSPYLKNISVPYLIKGVELRCTSNNSHFKWYVSGSDTYFTWVLPEPAGYDVTETYTFDTYFAPSDNTLRFMLRPTSNPSTSLNLCRVGPIEYYSGNYFNTQVYIYGDGRTYNFKFGLE